MAKINLSSLLKGSESMENMELDERSTKVNKQLHIIGLIISILMLVVTLVLLIIAITKVYSINQDFTSKVVSYSTANNVNTVVASILLLLVTSMTGLIFFRLYQEKPPFSRGNIRIIRFVAVLLVLLSVLPIVFQVGVAGFLNIPIKKISINYMYIFIGMIFYCISYVFEHGDIVQRQISQVETIRLASMLHDIGNILIPSEIIEKESTLNDEEFAIMKTHVVAGEQLLQNAEGNVMEMARQIALDHHEHWNGAGYLGKIGKEISLPGRIVAVADTFDMLISARGYKSGWDTNKVYHGICDDSGKKFDPEVVKVFIICYKELLEVFKKYNKTASKDAPLPDEIVASYDKILGEFNRKNQPQEESSVSVSKSYQDVELDLRRLI